MACIISTFVTHSQSGMWSAWSEQSFGYSTTAGPRTNTSSVEYVIAGQRSGSLIGKGSDSCVSKNIQSQ